MGPYTANIVLCVVALVSFAASHPFDLSELSTNPIRPATKDARFVTQGISSAASSKGTDVAEEKRADDGTQICVQYAEDSPSDIQDSIDWFKNWSAGQNGYLPKVLQEEFAIPTKAFNCPGPSEKNSEIFACLVVNENYCFNGKGTEDDLKKAWNILNLIARYRILRTVLEATYSFTLVPPNGKGYGQGLVRDFAQILKDFFNGAMGDSPIPGTDILNTIGSLFLFAPYGVANSTTLFNANLAALQAADSKAFQNCNWYDLAHSADCINKPGFNAVWGEMNKLDADFDKNLDWTVVASDMAPLSVPLQPDMQLVMAGYKDFINVFQRAMWMQVQRQQNVFFHVQPYDLSNDTNTNYWDVGCPAIVSDITGGWCKDTTASPDDFQSLAYYPVQIHAGENDTVSRDYPAFNAVSGYSWDSRKILGQSHRCADLKSQSFDLKPSYPQIFDMIRDKDNALSWIAAVDRANIDYIDCLWSLPMMHFSEGPNFHGMDKFTDTLKNDVGQFFGADSLGMENHTPRARWKIDNPRDYQVWQVIRDDRVYCPQHDPTPAMEAGWGIVEGDDQFLSDLFASQQIVRPNTNASSALEQVHQAACQKKISDTYAVLTKEAIDIMINIVAGYVAPGWGWIAIKILSMSLIAATSQTFADDYWLRSWVDGKLRQQFTLTGDAKTEVEDFLTPFFKTNKVGDGIQ